jgi:hypothetical protein
MRLTNSCSEQLLESGLCQASQRDLYELVLELYVPMAGTSLRPGKAPSSLKRQK